MVFCSLGPSSWPTPTIHFTSSRGPASHNKLASKPPLDLFCYSAGLLWLGLSWTGRRSISIRPMDKPHSNTDIGLSIWDLGTNGAPLSNKHENQPSTHQRMPGTQSYVDRTQNVRHEQSCFVAEHKLHYHSPFFIDYNPQSPHAPGTSHMQQMHSTSFTITQHQHHFEFVISFILSRHLLHFNSSHKAGIARTGWEQKLYDGQRSRAW